MSEKQAYILKQVRNPRSGSLWNIPRVMPGPMEGIMKGCFCEAAARLNLLDAWLSPFIRISTEVPGDSVLRKTLAHYQHTRVPLIVQLLGDDPEKLCRAADRLMNFDIAGIDINFACPSKRVLQHGGGGSLLADLVKMLDICKKLRSVTSGISFSAKVRTGLKSAEEMRVFIPELCACGLDFITVHFRTVEEFYSEATGREDRLREAVLLAHGTPVLASGDVYRFEDAIVLRDCGCTGIMGARGWLKDPLLLRKMKPVFGGAAENLNSSTDGRELLFGAMCTLALHHPEKYWRRSAFTEMAVQMWGASSKRFLMFQQLNDKDFLGQLSNPDLDKILS